LCSALNSHPEIICEYEYFGRNTNNTLYDLQQLFNWHNSGMIVGFKLKYRFQYFDNPDVWEYLLENDVKVIRLFRKNALKTVISRIRHHDGDKGGKKTTIPVENLIKKIKKWERKKALVSLSESFTNKLVICYEDILYDEQATFAKILDFLEVDSNITLTSRWNKVTSDNIEEAVTNYDEIVDTLKGTEYERFL